MRTLANAAEANANVATIATATVAVAPAAPSPRIFTGLAYDAGHGQTVLFGGWDGFPYLGDTWTWDGADWTRRDPAPSSTPQPRYGMGMAYDAAHGQVVLFGGF